MFTKLLKMPTTSRKLFALVYCKLLAVNYCQAYAIPQGGRGLASCWLTVIGIG